MFLTLNYFNFTESNDFTRFFEQDYKPLLFENDFKAAFPELFLVVATITLLLFGVIYSTSQEKKYPILLTTMTWLSSLSLVFTFYLLINSKIGDGVIFYNTFIIDDFTYFLKILVIIASLLTTLIAIEYTKQEKMNGFEYIILILFSCSTMLFLISSLDFITMYLAIELQSLCFYVLAASKRDSEFSTEAGLKYFLLGAFSSGLLLFGCSLIYGFTGVTNFTELAKIFTCGINDLSIGYPSMRGLELGMIFIIVGFLFKLTAVPFHMWAPDVYEGAPTSVTAFFSIVPKISVLAVFLRLFFESFYDFMYPWQKILILSSLASMIFGALAAMAQNKIKRLLAFSSIVNVGYILIGFCCGTIEGLQALLIYLFIYVIMTLNIFAVILSPIRREFVESVNRVKYTTDLAMVGKTNPALAFNLTITMFSLAGIPPLAGFLSKAFLFFAAMSSNMFVLALVGVIASVISCFYYIRIIKIMYFEKSQTWCSFSRISKENGIILSFTLFFLLFFITYPSPLYLATHKAALALCG